MEINEIIEAEIIDITEDGQGIAKHDNKVIFIEDVVIGDIVKLKIIEQKKQIFIGKKIEIIKLSEHRIKPIHNEDALKDVQCFMYTNYEKEKEVKINKIKNAIEKIAKIEIPRPILLCPEEPYHYRNKVELKVKNGKIGYFKKKTHDFVEVKESSLLQREINNTIKKLDPILSKIKSLKQLVIHANSNDEIMIIFISEKEENLNQFLEIYENEKNWIQIHHSINNKKNDYRIGKDIKLVYKTKDFFRSIGDKKFLVSPKSFFQINNTMTKVLYDKAFEMLNPKENENIVELYSGVGSISIYFAKNKLKICGVEIEKQAVEDAKYNAKINNKTNLEYKLGKAENIFKEIKKGIDTLILDPPRAGLKNELCLEILNEEPKKILYISCNPATLARDLKLLKEKYTINEIVGVDMFPRTMHVETIALLERNDY